MNPNRPIDDRTPEEINLFHVALWRWIIQRAPDAPPVTDEGFSFTTEPGPVRGGRQSVIVRIGVWVMDFREELETEFSSFGGREITFAYDDDLDDPKLQIRFLRKLLRRYKRRRRPGGDSPDGEGAEPTNNP